MKEMNYEDSCCYYRSQYFKNILEKTVPVLFKDIDIILKDADFFGKVNFLFKMYRYL